MYHRIAERPPGVPEPTWNVTPRQFRRQVEGLLERGFEAWPLRRIIDYGHRNLAIPPRVFVVTFDDGYESVYCNAWPILRELRVPATVFLATAYIGRETPFPYDDWPEAGSHRVPAHTWRLMDWAQCREISAEGLVELGSHTHTHGCFKACPEVFAADLARSLEEMRAHCRLTGVPFAFPFGHTDPALARAAREAGVTCGLTAEERLADTTGDPYDWGRFTVDEADTTAAIAACLNGWPDFIRSGPWPWR